MALHTDSNANVNKATIVITCKKVNENSGSELSMSPFDVCWLMQNAVLYNATEVLSGTIQTWMSSWSLPKILFDSGFWLLKRGGAMI